MTIAIKPSRIHEYSIKSYQKNESIFARVLLYFEEKILKASKHNPKEWIIREFRDKNIDVLPISQRLPVRETDSKTGKTKEVEIIETLLDGYGIGEITLMSLLNRKGRRIVASNKFDWESIDGGHRKRAILSFLKGEFEVRGQTFQQMSNDEQEAFLNIKLSFDIYDYLGNAERGKIFRNLNKTTDVNFIEMLNSYGDTAVANFVRYLARHVKKIDNSFHDLFDFHEKTGKPIYKYLQFDNDRLKIDHMVDRELEDMYQNEAINDDLLDDVKPKVTKHFDFLRQMADYRKKKFSKGLSQHDFKVLSYLYFYILDNYGSVNLEDSELFYDNFAKANGILMNKEGKYGEEIHATSGYSVPIMYSRYIGAPGFSSKIKMAMMYLIKEMDDLENFLEIRDTKREFTRLEKEARLAEQNFKCAVDGEPLDWKDAHAAHIESYKKGGKTIYSNLVMVRARYNLEMGTMDFNDYMSMKKSAA